MHLILCKLTNAKKIDFILLLNKNPPFNKNPPLFKGKFSDFENIFNKTPPFVPKNIVHISYIFSCVSCSMEPDKMSLPQCIDFIETPVYGFII